MKPAPKKTRYPGVDGLNRGDIENLVQRAQQADDPDYYVQQATGRVLTILVVGVGALQIGGVFLWLILVFSGLVDASMNLDAFMISQLAVFITSIGMGAVWTMHRLKSLRAEAESMQPEVAQSMLQLLMDDVECTDTEDFPEITGLDAEFDAVIRCETDEASYYFADASEARAVEGLVLVADIGQHNRQTTLIEPCDKSSPRLETTDELEDVETGDADFDETFTVSSSDPIAATSWLDKALRQRLTAFLQAAKRRDRKQDDREDEPRDFGGDFSFIIDDDHIAAIRRSRAPLFAPDAGDITTEQLMNSAAEISRALQSMELIARRDDPPQNGG